MRIFDSAGYAKYANFSTYTETSPKGPIWPGVVPRGPQSGPELKFSQYLSSYIFEDFFKFLAFYLNFSEFLKCLKLGRNRSQWSLEVSRSWPKGPESKWLQ